MPLGQEIELQGELSPQFIEETNVKQTAAQAFSQRSDYKNISLIRDAMEYRIKIERGSALPMVSFGYTYQFNGQSESFSFGSHNLVNSQNAALTISFPIFDGGKSSARIQQVKIDVQKMDYQLIKMKEAIEVQATQAWNMMSDAHKRMDALEKTVGQAEKAYSIAQVRYESGQGTQLELFDAQVALETAQFNRLQSIFDYESARALWENAIGN
jgi:outer membrane protein TolC